NLQLGKRIDFLLKRFPDMECPVVKGIGEYRNSENHKFFSGTRLVSDVKIIYSVRDDKAIYQGGYLIMSNKDVLSALNNILSLVEGMTPEMYESFEPGLLAEARELIQTDYSSDDSFTIISDPASAAEIVAMEEIDICGNISKEKPSLKS
ncbi:MAG: hypothetical protein PHY83_05075, partial [Bacilli bacterium]|nr:hypothetical protein [Bacilli bacterium]